MDPIYQFKNTTRALTLALKIPAASDSEAFENLAKVQALTQFLYPNYLDVASATTIAQSPVLRLGVMNLGRSQNEFYNVEGRVDGHPFTAEGANLSTVPRTGDSGLLGVLTSLTINHNLGGEIGVIERGGGSNARGTPQIGGSVLPKLIEITFDFKVIHEHPLGWNQEGEFSNEAFPYGVNFEDSGPKDFHAMNRLEEKSMAAVTKRRQRQMEEEENREIAEQALANAEARYSGIFGERRRKRDTDAMFRGKASQEQISALAGAFAMEHRSFEGDHADAADTAMSVRQRTDINETAQDD